MKKGGNKIVIQNSESGIMGLIRPIPSKNKANVSIG